jgi:hypothetical protein
VVASWPVLISGRLIAVARGGASHGGLGGVARANYGVGGRGVATGVMSVLATRWDDD